MIGIIFRNMLMSLGVIIVFILILLAIFILWHVFVGIKDSFKDDGNVEWIEGEVSEMLKRRKDDEAK